MEGGGYWIVDRRHQRMENREWNLVWSAGGRTSRSSSERRGEGEGTGVDKLEGLISGTH